MGPESTEDRLPEYDGNEDEESADRGRGRSGGGPNLEVEWMKLASLVNVMCLTKAETKMVEV